MAERGMLFSGPLVKAILDGRKTETRRPVTKSSSAAYDVTGRRGEWPQSLDGAERKFVAMARQAERDALLIPAQPCSVAPYIKVGAPRYVTPHIQAGDLIYVRETHAVVWNEADECGCEVPGSWCPEHSTIDYRADTVAVAPAGWDNCNPEDRLLKWTPSIHMPRDRSRIDLRVTEVLAERVQDITNDGAIAEGIAPDEDCPMEGLDQREPNERDAFARVWDSIYSTHLGLAWGENPWVWRIKFEVEKVRT